MIIRVSSDRPRARLAEEAVLRETCKVVATPRSTRTSFRTVISFPSSFNALKRGRSYHPEPSRVAHLLSLLSFAADGEATGGSKSINVCCALRRPTNKFY